MSYALQHLLDRTRRRGAEVRPRIAGVSMLPLGAVTLTLDLAPLAHGVRGERWRIQSRGRCRFRFVSPDAFPIAIAQRHPVLSADREPWDELRLSGRPRFVAQCIDALHGAHARWAEGFLPFDFFFDPRVALERSLANGAEVTVVGPRGYIATLQRALVPFELNVSVRPQEARSGQPQAAGTILLLGASYFAAAGFGAEPVAPTPDGR